MSCECESWAEHLFEPEEALTDAEREGLERHLASCESCAVERELFLDSWSALDGAEEELEPCPLLRARVWEKIREEESQPKPFLPSLSVEGRPWRDTTIKIVAAAAAIMLGFGVGRSLRSTPVEAGAPAMAEATQSEKFLDPELIKLASQEGYSTEIFPEATQFSPIDREMMTALASSKESREWLAVEGGAVVPLQYISRGLPPQKGRKVR